MVPLIISSSLTSVFCLDDPDIKSIYLFEKKGAGMICVYWYEIGDRFYISNLSVCEWAKNKGIGRTLLQNAELIAETLQYKTVSLWVKEGSWMQNWYEREGYIYDCKHTDEEFIWMRKII